MKVVLDTSAIIYLNDFRMFEEMMTVQKVVREVQDRISTIKLSTLKLKVAEPREETIGEIKRMAKKTGDLENLSETDVEILALAKDKKCTLISDDRSVQNVAQAIGIRYISVFSPKITSLVIWKKFCGNCKRYFDKGSVCPVCGEELRKTAKESVQIGK